MTDASHNVATPLADLPALLTSADCRLTTLLCLFPLTYSTAHFYCKSCMQISRVQAHATGRGRQ